MPKNKLKGSCLCGDVRYRVADGFEYALICHCSNCRRATGSAFKPFGGIDRRKLEVTRGRIKRFGSAKTHNAHCARCGSLLYSIVSGCAIARAAGAHLRGVQGLVGSDPG